LRPSWPCADAYGVMDHDLCGSRLIPDRPAGTWATRYGPRQQLHRLQEFPPGIAPPKRVRIYARNGHFVLQWWDPRAKSNLCDRVEGDLIDAVARARQIEQRLVDFRRSGHGRRRIRHEQLVAMYTEDLQRRAAAGEVAPATVARYASALAHYLDFATQTAVAPRYSYVTTVDRPFALDLAGHLRALELSRNGHPHAARRRMQTADLVLDCVRAMYAWAADPDRGNRLPEGFRNPFLHRHTQRRRTPVDLTSAPDITAAMAAEFLSACDEYALRLFAPYVFCGLRAAEPVFLFQEFIAGDWLSVPCIRELDYATKGRRDKRLPLLAELRALLLRNAASYGLTYVRRTVATGAERPPLAGASLAEVIATYAQRRQRAGHLEPCDAERLRDAVLRDAGATNYDAIQREFRRIARVLGWPAAATLKGFRHLFSTALANGGIPAHERQYLMGHAPRREAIVAYTHLDKLIEHYRRAVEAEPGAPLAALRRRVSGGSSA
jgi:integrase